MNRGFIYRLQKLSAILPPASAERFILIIILKVLNVFSLLRDILFIAG